MTKFLVVTIMGALLAGVVTLTAACSSTSNQGMGTSQLSRAANSGPAVSGTLITVSSPDRPLVLVRPDDPEYAEVYELLGSDGRHEVSREGWQQVMDIMGYEYGPTEEAETARWQQRLDHWDNIEAFKARILKINDDRVIDRAELDSMCFLSAQWKAQLVAARDYVKDYREDDPELVERNKGLQNLETEAEAALRVVSSVIESCP